MWSGHGGGWGWGEGKGSSLQRAPNPVRGSPALTKYPIERENNCLSDIFLMMAEEEPKEGRSPSLATGHYHTLGRGTSPWPLTQKEALFTDGAGRKLTPMM